MLLDTYRVTKPRAALYLRQSTFKEESISLELQETACRTYALQQGYDVVAVESDPGISGRTFKRPGVQRVMDLVEAKNADVIVLWKWSRWSRSRLDWAVAADKVETFGGRIESATEQVDVSTSTGRLARGMLTEFAAFESERIGDTWKESHARRIKMGLPHHGLPRFGYNYSKASGYTVDEATGPVLREMYLRFIRGATMRELAAYTASEGCEPSSGWQLGTLGRTLDRGFGAGYIFSKSELVKGAHEPVISEAEWEQFQLRRNTRKGRPRAEASDYAYSGLLLCHCGAKMAGASTTNKAGVTYRRYVCLAAQQKRTHKMASISDLQVENAVLEWLKTVSQELDKAAAGVHSVPKAPNLARKKAQIGAEILKNASRIDKLGIRYLDDEFSKTEFDRLKAGLVEEKAALEARLRILEVNATAQPAAIVPLLLEGWSEAPARLKRETLGTLVAEIRLSDWSEGFRKGSRTLTITPVWE